MNEPRQPADHPAPEHSDHLEPERSKPEELARHPENGVPADADTAEPKGTPHADRHATETAGKA